MSSDTVAATPALAVEELTAGYGGVIALNGVSLTVAGVEGRIVEVSLIPETLERTTFGTVAAGDPVNVEVDVIARHAERLLQGFEVSDGK